MHIKRTITALAAFAILMAVAACGSSGSSGGNTVSTFEPRYAYVLNENDPSVSWYLINEQTGDPRHLGYLYLGEEADSVHDMVLHPDGNAMYVSDPDLEAIHVLAVNSTTGRLSYEEAVAYTRSMWDMEMAPDGGFVIVAQGPGDPAMDNPERFAVFQLGDESVPLPSTTLTDEISFDFSPPGEGRKSLSSDGRMLFFGIVDQIASLPVDPNGTLHSDDLIVTTQNPEITDVTADPDGHYLYAVAKDGEAPGNILAYTINNDGSLTLMDNDTASGHQAFVSVSPHGGEFYALNDDGIVTVGTFDADTDTLAISVLGDAADPARTNVAWATADPSGQFLYTATSGLDDGESLGVTNIENLEASTYTPRFGSIARERPSRIVFAAGNPIQLTGMHLYAADWSEDSSQIERFVIESDGALTNPVVNDEGHDGVRGLAILPGLDILFSAHHEETGNVGSVRASRIDQTNGTLSDGVVLRFSPAGSFYLDPVGLVIEPSGRFLYSASSRTPEDDYGSIRVFYYSRDSHFLDFGIHRSSPDTDYLALTSDPAGRFLYTATEQNEILGWTLDETEARLGSGLTSMSITGPTALTVSPDGAFLVAVTDNGASSTVTGYRISSTDGELTLINNRDLSAPGVAVDFHPSGQWIYAVSRDDGANENHLEVFSLSEDGSLSTEPVFSDTHTSAANAYASVVVHPLGTALYVATETTSQEGYIQRFEIDADDGGLVQAPTLETFSVQQPRSLAIYSTRQ